MLLKGLRCYLSTAAGPLIELATDSTREYDSQAESDTKTAYVQAEDNARFAFHIEATELGLFEFGEAELLLNTHVSIDGVGAPTSKRWDRIAAVLGIKHDYIMFKQTDSKTGEVKSELRKLKFAAISSLEDEQPEQEQMIAQENFSGIGEFKIVVRRGFRSEEKTPWSTSEEISPSENAVKDRNVSHRIELEKTELVDSPSGFWKLIPHEPDGSPYATFRFIYRSKEALQNLGLLESTPEQEQVDDDDDDDDEELLAAKSYAKTAESAAKAAELAVKATEAAAIQAEGRLVELRRRKSGRVGLKRGRADEPSGNIPRSKKAKPNAVDLT